MTGDRASETTDAVKIIRGNPTDEEIAAVVSVITAHAAQAPEPQQQPRSGWAAYWRAANSPLRPGPGSWQAAVRDW